MVFHFMSYTAKNSYPDLVWRCHVGIILWSNILYWNSDTEISQSVFMKVNSEQFYQSKL